ncbi:hypothetical protein MXB_5164 [Myxobolus squamalis]|nr:hypothetical protein MXB_5164 [Myxobolus squamalis]
MSHINFAFRVAQLHHTVELSVSCLG